MELHEMFESMNIEQTEKENLQEAFDAAVLKETTALIGEHTDKVIAEKEEILKEEYEAKVENLSESLDGYLDTVVEEFIEENTATYEAKIAEDKVSAILEAFDTIVKTTGATLIDIQESKDENSVETKLEEAEDKISTMADKLVESKREADKYLKGGVIMEMASDLTVIEVSKFEKLAEMVAFSRDASYITKLETIKESLIDSRDASFDASIELPTDAFKHGRAVDTKKATDFSKYV